MSTIYALASARGKSGVSVVRISGTRAFDACDYFGFARPKAREFALARLLHEDQLLDEALVVAFPGPKSFTGEDILELHVHGSSAVVKAVLTHLSGIEEFEMAQPGEFTRRALENDKLDLAQVEGLADLIEAETEAQRIQAMRIFSGAIGEKVERWRNSLVRAASLIEVTIDFADEDVPVNVVPEVTELLRGVLTDLRGEANGSRFSERLRGGFQIAIVGRPNVGKSTLLNALAGREAAITSELAGTTRDVIEVQMDLGGLPVTFLDTAGLRDSVDVVERLGIERAKERAELSDLRVVLVEDRLQEPPVLLRDDDILLVSKADLGNGDISGETGFGIDRLIAKIIDTLSERVDQASTITRERHRIAVDRGIMALGIALERLETAPEFVELVAEDIRASIRALDALVGRVDVEHLLDEVFKSFCIGK